ncbi:hypothetical protein Bca4012_064570 [Brassica carinata]
MNAHEAEAAAQQAVSKVEAAMTTAEEAQRKQMHQKLLELELMPKKLQKHCKENKICKVVNTLFLYHTTHDKENTFSWPY